MQTIIHDTTIVTADEQSTVHYDAAIAIADDRIVALGPNAEVLARYPAAERIDGRAAWRRLFEERPELQPPPGLHLG
jgi:cytosine/adenosine deaminase-related metal-dependent hydrolase